MKKIYIVPRLLESINLHEDLLQGSVDKKESLSEDKKTGGNGIIDADTKLFQFNDVLEESW